jgi:DNA-binding LytR/AlgR family response regulator
MTRGALSLLAVDDEPPARADLVRMLSAMPCVGRVAAAASAVDALAALETEDPFDGIFLDVHMPGFDGIQLARVLSRFERPPGLVFVSAYDRFAVEAFAVAALDYLLKPVAGGRLREAVRRVALARPERRREDMPDDPGVVSVDALTGGGTHLLRRDSVVYLQAHGDYVRVRSTEGRFLAHASLRDIAARWAPHGFLRVHRGFVVNLRCAVEIQPEANGTATMLMRDGSRIPIARRHVGELRRRLSL